MFGYLNRCHSLGVGVVPWVSYRTVARIDRRSQIAANNSLREACGLFASRPSGEIRLRFLPNLTSDKGSYRLRIADLKLLPPKPNVCGVFHTHPIGPSVATEEDHDKRLIGRYLLVYSDTFSQIKLWRLKQNSDFIQVPLLVRPH